MRRIICDARVYVVMRNTNFETLAALADIHFTTSAEVGAALYDARCEAFDALVQVVALENRMSVKETVDRAIDSYILHRSLRGNAA